MGGKLPQNRHERLCRRRLARACGRGSATRIGCLRGGPAELAVRHYRRSRGIGSPPPPRSPPSRRHARLDHSASGPQHAASRRSERRRARSARRLRCAVIVPPVRPPRYLRSRASRTLRRGFSERFAHSRPTASSALDLAGSGVRPSSSTAAPGQVGRRGLSGAQAHGWLSTATPAAQSTRSRIATWSSPGASGPFVQASRWRVAEASGERDAHVRGKLVLVVGWPKPEPDGRESAAVDPPAAGSASE